MYLIKGLCLKERSPLIVKGEVIDDGTNIVITLTDAIDEIMADSLVNNYLANVKDGSWKIWKELKNGE